ncbi:MAG: M20 metallopeptidase family protein [Solirubrobacteraceae bacterium]
MARSTDRAGAAPSGAEAALLESLLRALEPELAGAVELRRRLHARPELAHAEHETAAAVAAALPVAAERAAGTGLLALIGGEAARERDANREEDAQREAGPARPVAVRAELDGLALEERTGSPFTAAGSAMHACGHDVHMAALVALARAAHTLGERLPAPLLAVFQPSEESYPSGAQQLVREGFGVHRPAAVLGAHVHPELPWGSVALDAGVVNASCDAIEIVVEGEPAHGAYPHLGADPVPALSQIVVAMHARVGRVIDPVQVAGVTIGQLQAGSSDNVIASTARARGTLRAYRLQDRERLRQIASEVAQGVAAAHGCRGSVVLEAGEPALENDAAIVAGARDLLPAAGLTAAAEWRSAGSDDFAFFGELAPLAMAFVGLDGAEGFTRRPLHHPELLPPDAAVAAVARTQAVLYAAVAARAAASERPAAG